MEKFQGKKIYSTSGRVVARTISDETILVPVSGNTADMERIYTLNEVGATIWRLLDGNRDLETIWSELIEEFDVSHEDLRRDIAEFMERLAVLDLVQERAAA